jgi:hypothetical protein
MIESFHHLLPLFGLLTTIVLQERRKQMAALERGRWYSDFTESGSYE